METILKNSLNFKCAVNQPCLEEHSNISRIIQAAFNFFRKNKLKRLNASKLNEKKKKKKERTDQVNYTPGLANR